MQEPDSPAERPSQVEEGGSGFGKINIKSDIFYFLV